MAEQLIGHSFTWATDRQQKGLESSQHVKTDGILEDLMTVGILKAQGVPRTDPRIQMLDRTTNARVKSIIESSEGTLLGRRVAAYQGILEHYIEGEGTLSTLRGFVKDTFTPTFSGKHKFAEDVAKHGPGLLVANHNTHTSEIDVVDDAGRVLHDVGPVVTRLAMDATLQGTDVTVTRLVKTPNPSAFYSKVMTEMGNILLSTEGVDGIAEQMKYVADAGEVPALSPEGGFRVFEKWNTGPVVLAVKSGLTHLHLVGHSPLVSLLNPEMDFDYLGMKEIPQKVVEAVNAGDKEPVRAFSDEVREDFATGIQGLSYPTIYKQHVAKFARK